MKKSLMRICLICLLLVMPMVKAERLKLYTFYTPTHKVFFDEWFLPSLLDDYEVIAAFYEQECPSGAYKTTGWVPTMLHKVELLIHAIKENWGKFFIYADADIQFFRPTEGVIKSLIKKYDMIIQKDHPEGLSCAGFFVCRGNERTLRLWEEIKRRLSDEKYIKMHPKTSDQPELHNLTIKSNPFNVKWALLPDTFFSGGTLTGKRWNLGDSLPVPQGIYLHHANWTVGVENKIAQLVYVKNAVEVSA